MDTDQLLELAEQGDASATNELLGRFRGRLKGMVRARMDPRLSKRVDPSDIVQESLLDAATRMQDYLHSQPIPFYAWLRQFAWERLLQTHRKHIRAKMRTVTREQIGTPSDHSRFQLAHKLAGPGSSPSRIVARRENLQRLQVAVENLSTEDQELLVLRYVEQLSPQEDKATVVL